MPGADGGPGWGTADRGRQPPARRLRVAGQWPDPNDWLTDAAGERGQGLGRASQPGGSLLLWGLSCRDSCCACLMAPKAVRWSACPSTNFRTRPSTRPICGATGAGLCGPAGTGISRRRLADAVAEATVLDDLPIFGVERDGEYCLQPCAETLLSRRAAERILSVGLMPLLTVKGTGTAQLAAWQSVAASGSRPGGTLGLNFPSGHQIQDLQRPRAAPGRVCRPRRP